VTVPEGYVLYYSASLVRVPDCGFDEPLHIGVARAAALEGPWRPDPQPVISPRPDDPRCNLGAGAIKVLRLDDGFVGLHNGIALDAGGASRSAISVRTSLDGTSWRYAHGEPIARLRPAGARDSSTPATSAAIPGAGAGTSTSTPATGPR
jgi:hypothetical protein